MEIHRGKTGKRNGRNCAAGADAGFTLVELLVAVVILTVIAIPFMHAFVSSARTNAKARNIAQATTAAQNLMEEIKAEPLEEILKTSREETVMMDVVSGKAYKVYHYDYGDITVNGTDYETEVLLDANYYTDGTAGAEGLCDETTDYNQSELPHIYDKNPVLDASYVQESTQDEQMAARFYGDSSAVRSGMKREIFLEISKNDDEIKAEVSTAYTWNGKTKYASSQKQCIYRNTGGTDNLRNIYLYFWPMSYSGSVREFITVKNLDKVPVNVYLIRQGSVPDGADGYRMEVKVLEEGRGYGDYDAGGELKVLTHLRTNLKAETKSVGGVMEYQQMNLLYGTSEGSYAVSLPVAVGGVNKNCTSAELTDLRDLSARMQEDVIYNVTVNVYEKGGKSSGKALVSLLGTKEK